MSAKNVLKKLTHDRNFTIIDNKLLQNPNLSAKAKGIACYLLSLPDDWDIIQSELTKHFTDGIDSIKGGIKELKEAGYVVVVSLRNDKGQITDWETYIRESLDIPFPNEIKGSIQKREIQILGSPHVVNPQQLSTNTNTKNLFNKTTTVVVDEKLLENIRRLASEWKISDFDLNALLSRFEPSLIHKQLLALSNAKGVEKPLGWLTAALKRGFEHEDKKSNEMNPAGPELWTEAKYEQSCREAEARVNPADWREELMRTKLQPSGDV